MAGTSKMVPIEPSEAMLEAGLASIPFDTEAEVTLDMVCQLYRDMLAGVRPIVSSPVSGWVSVPLAPTPSMEESSGVSLYRLGNPNRRKTRALWTAMLDAAPPPPGKSPHNQ